MKVRVLLFIIFSVVLLNTTNAQKPKGKIEITGTVLDISKNPVSNAIIMIDGNNTSVKTDNAGKYRIKVSAKATTIGVFTFSSGMIEQAIEGRTVIDFNFSKSAVNQQPAQEAAPNEEGVNTGYANVKQKSVLTDVNNIDAKSKYAKYNNIYDLIRSEVSGVEIKQSGIIIQDSKNLWGSVPALLVVDGVYVDNLDGVNPANVESISVLKGTSASIYGSRGYGGAVVIKTKTK